MVQILRQERECEDCSSTEILTDGFRVAPHRQLHLRRAPVLRDRLSAESYVVRSDGGGSARKTQIADLELERLIYQNVGGL